MRPRTPPHRRAAAVVLEIGVEEDAAHEDDFRSVADEERLAETSGIHISGKE